jgi:S-DNA-T family DNA segregation ATPase FtsK/SpoIIIE
MGRVVITVVAPGRRVDLAVADETPVAALLPVVLDLCAADPGVPWTLTPKGGRALDPDRTLGECGVLHGSILLLERAAAPAVAAPRPAPVPAPAAAPAPVPAAVVAVPRPDPPPPPPRPDPRPRRPAHRLRRPGARAPEVGALPVAELRIVSGPSAGRRVPLEPGEHRVGSHRYSRIVLQDRALARVHLAVHVDAGGGVTVAPAEDATCLLDGERLTGPARLRPGQVLVAGRSLLAFGRPGEGAPPPPPGLAMTGTDAPRIEAPSLPLSHPNGVLLGGAAAGTVVAAGVTAAIWGPPAALVPIALGPVAGFGALAWNRRGHLEARALFRTRLAELNRTLTAVRDARLAELTALAPDAAELLFQLESGSLVRDRRPDGPDWLRLRLGWADRPSGLGAVVPPRGEPGLRTEAIRVAVRHGVLRGAPVSVGLPDGGPLGIAGDAGEGLALARWLAIQVAALHAPEDVALTAALPASDGFEWLDGLPHLLASLPALVVGDDAARALVDRLAALIAQRGAGRSPGPRVVAILHCRVVPAVARALSTGQRVGVHVIWLDADDERRRTCGAVIDLPAGEPRPWLTTLGLGPQPLGGADGLSPELAGRATAALRRPPRAAPGSVRVELADLLGTGEHPEAHVLGCWIRDRTSAPPRRLRAAVGVDAAGLPVDVALGHVLVSGAAGTGRTELLQGMLVSLAARHAPRDVRLLLGSMPDLAGLPHAVAWSDEEQLRAGLGRPDLSVVVAVDELPPAPRRERLLEALSEAVQRRPEDVHLLVATSEPDAVREAIGPAVSIAMGPAAGGAVITDTDGRSWTTQVAGTSSLPRLVEAVGAAGRTLRL